MNPISLELSLSVKPSYVPKSLSSLLFDLSRIDNDYCKLSVLSDYICKHEEELSRVEALKHQLPQCRLLLMGAIETLKEEFLNINNNLQRKTKHNENEEQREIHVITCSPTEEDYANKHKTLTLENNFQESTWNCIGSSSSRKEKEVGGIDESSRNYNDHQGFMYPMKTDDENTLNNVDHSKPLTQPIWRNNRRCWSSELHSRFVLAVNMVGGIGVATPKQVRDLMKVEGLTIDVVKSHLQDCVQSHPSHIKLFNFDEVAVIAITEHVRNIDFNVVRLGYSADLS